MKKGYDNAAPFYDRLSWLVFGDELLQAQRWLVQRIPASSRILIVGGGTGWILEQIAAVNAQGLIIDYVEISPKMMNYARRRRYGNNTVTFFEAAVQDVEFGVKEYDVVITPFVFDGFTEQDLQQAFSAINTVLVTGGLWLNCDFVDTGKRRHRMLLWVMYAFFRLLGSVQVSRLPDIAACFTRHSYRRTAQHAYMHGFVDAAIYQRR